MRQVQKYSKNLKSKNVTEKSDQILKKNKFEGNIGQEKFKRMKKKTDENLRCCYLKKFEI